MSSDPSTGRVSSQPTPLGSGTGLALSVQLSFLTALQLCFSFGIQAYTLYRLGVGVQTDALATGFTIPQVTMIVAVEMLTLVLVPLLAATPEPELLQNGWQLFLGFGGLSSALTILVLLATPLLIRLIVPGFSSQEQQLAISLARIQVFSIVGAACYAVLTSLHQVRGRFLRPVAALLASHVLGALILVYKVHSTDVRLIAWVQLMLNTLPAICLLSILRSPKHFKADFAIVRTVLRGMRPLCLGAAYFRTSTIPDRIMASFLGPGSIVMLDFVNRTYGAVERIINQGVVTPVVPELARLYKAGNIAGFYKLYRSKVVHIIALSASILGAGIIVFGLAMKPDLFGSWHSLPGRLSTSKITAIAVLFLYMSGRLLFSGASHTAASAFYAAGNWTEPTKINAFTYTAGLVARVAGFFVAGLAGIAVSVSLYIALNLFLLHQRLWRFCVEHGHAVEVKPEGAPETITEHILRIAARLGRA